MPRSSSSADRGGPASTTESPERDAPRLPGDRSRPDGRRGRRGASRDRARRLQVTPIPPEETMDPITLLIAGLIGAALVACIAWRAIRDWMEQKKREEHARVV